MVRLDPPELDSASAWVRLLPTATLPRLRLAGALRYPAVGVVPVRDTATGELDALELMESVALSVPVVDGVKVTDRLALPPAGRV
jgi:hypothetical protein